MNNLQPLSRWNDEFRTIFWTRAQTSFVIQSARAERVWVRWTVKQIEPAHNHLCISENFFERSRC
jgi:hypothetical protein